MGEIYPQRCSITIIIQEDGDRLWFVLWDNLLFQSCLRLLSILSLCVSDDVSQFSSIVGTRFNYPHLMSAFKNGTG